MRYTKEFKLECIRKYKSGEHIADPPGITHHAFHNMVLRWTSIYDILGEKGLVHDKPKLSTNEILVLIKRVESGESYSKVAYSVGRHESLVSKWHKIYLQDGIDGLKSLKSGRPMKEIKPKIEDTKKPLTLEDRIKELEEINEYLRCENEYLKKLNALVQKRKDQEPKKK